MDDEIAIIKVVVSQDVVFLYEKKISLKGNFKNYFIIYINCLFFLNVIISKSVLFRWLTFLQN
jgi:hypothetical protein